MQSLRFSVAILHYLCIFNGKFKEKLAFVLKFAVPSVVVPEGIAAVLFSVLI